LEASSLEAALQSSWQHLTKVVKYAGLSPQGEFVPTEVECHGPINRDAVQFWASWAAGDWWRRPGMFEHLRFYPNRCSLWCNVLIQFYIMFTEACRYTCNQLFALRSS